MRAGAGERHDKTQEIGRSPVLCVPVNSSAQPVKLSPRCVPSGNAYRGCVLGEESAYALGISESHLVKGVIDVCMAAYDYQRLLQARHMCLDQLLELDGRYELCHSSYVLLPCIQNLLYVPAAIWKVTA